MHETAVSDMDDLRRSLVGLLPKLRRFAMTLARDAAAITLHDIYLAVGAPPLVQVGTRDSGGGCPIQHLVNSALLEGAREAQRLLDFLVSPEAKAIFEAAGFTVLAGQG